jgi:hypothetical protein
MAGENAVICQLSKTIDITAKFTGLIFATSPEVRILAVLS